jgi:8-oxo-dGTP pyrophosphatase MutT (NUDIX family)
MAHEVKIHDAQTAILRELLFHPEAGYAQMQKPTGLSSDHFNFHITRLMDLGYVEKVVKGQYKLTPKGKEYSNKLDTDTNTVERQPKVAVILAIENDHGQWLFQERLKQPYYGFWGFPSGKVRWGEMIKETAERELDEETGLSADFRIAGLYHEIVRSQETSEILEDKQFFLVHCTNPRGELRVDFEGGHNEWRFPKDVFGKEKHFDSVEIEIDLTRGVYTGEEVFFERMTSYDKTQF